jgi:hypothetical protein
VGAALVGLVLLVGNTVPAVLRHQRLGRDHARLLDEVDRQERRLRALAQELDAARGDGLTYAQAVHDLLHPPPAAPAR